METSHSLLDQLRQPSATDAWNRLIALYTPLLETWLRRRAILPPDDVEDLIQEVLLTVSQELPKFEHNQRQGAFRKWLRTILVHRLRNFWRLQQHRPGAIGGSDFLQFLEQLEDDDSELSDLWDREHDLYVMNHLLEQAEPQFAPHVWQAFYRQVMEGCPPATVAKELNMSLSAVYSARSRALSLLRAQANGMISSF